METTFASSFRMPAWLGYEEIIAELNAELEALDREIEATIQECKELQNGL